MERVEGIEPSTKPWQGLVLPLAPYPQLKLDCILYRRLCQAPCWYIWYDQLDLNQPRKNYEFSALPLCYGRKFGPA